MGQIAGTLLTRKVGLHANERPTFEHSVGFTCKRPERKALIGDNQLSSARIPYRYRDYCAHLLLDYQVCRYKVFPFVYRCHHERHAYLNCEHEDYVLRMKEFERERRLREREIRIKERNLRPAERMKPEEHTGPEESEELEEEETILDAMMRMGGGA